MDKDGEKQIGWDSKDHRKTKKIQIESLYKASGSSPTETVREGGKQYFFMLCTSWGGGETVHILQCLAGSHSSWQGVMFHYVLQNKKKKSRILFHIWHTLEISTFRLQMKSATCETERARLQIPCAVPVSAPEHDNVSLCQAVVAALFSGFLLKLLSFFFFFFLLRRCESSLHNKYRKGVLVCVCVKCGGCTRRSAFFCLTS